MIRVKVDAMPALYIVFNIYILLYRSITQQISAVSHNKAIFVYIAIIFIHSTFSCSSFVCVWFSFFFLFHFIYLSPSHDRTKIFKPMNNREFCVCFFSLYFVFGFIWRIKPPSDDARLWYRIDCSQIWSLHMGSEICVYEVAKKQKKKTNKMLPCIDAVDRTDNCCWIDNVRRPIRDLLSLLADVTTAVGRTYTTSIHFNFSYFNIISRYKMTCLQTILRPNEIAASA